MTDNEILKALECCVTPCTCGDCPMRKKQKSLGNCSGGCVELLCVHAHDLICSQRKELDKYRHIEQTVKDFWSELKKMSAFKNLQEPTLTELLEYIDQTNSEAIKEFAERLKDDVCNICPDRVFEYDEVESTIDNLVKEMVGDK